MAVFQVKEISANPTKIAVIPIFWLFTIFSFKKKYASNIVTAGYVAATGPTIDKNAVDILKLNVKNPARSSKPAKAINKKISRVGVENLILPIFVQENRMLIAVILKNRSAMIGPNATAAGLKRTYAIPQAIIDIKASDTPLDRPSRILFLSSAMLVDAKNIPMSTAITPMICRGTSDS